MPNLYSDKLEHINYCKVGFKDKYYLLISNDYYVIILKSDKFLFENYNAPIALRDKRMIELLGYWLDDISINLDNIYLLLRLKAVNNKDFLNWWKKYNFQLEIERINFK